MITLTMTMINEGGEWRVFAPNGHYKDGWTGDLPAVVSKVVADYAEWLKSRTSIIEHLVNRSA